MRTATIQRNTNETKISLTLQLDTKPSATIDTGVGFLDHMLTLFSFHARCSLTLHCQGDTYIDAHHTVEDIGIVLGEALLTALGDRRGMTRYGQMLLPMDESLVLVALDLSGRSYLGYDLNLPQGKVGDFDTELTQEFFEAFVRSSKSTLHLKQLAGCNTHHIIEAAFKGFGRALQMAVQQNNPDDEGVPSTKGLL